MTSSSCFARRTRRMPARPARPSPCPTSSGSTATCRTSSTSRTTSTCTPCSSLGGPLIKKKDNVKGLRAIDVAPTIAFLMDIPGPQNARGRILYDIDRAHGEPAGGHDPLGQRLPRPADPAGGGRQTTSARPVAYDIGGAAYLKKYFETTRPRPALSDKRAGVIEMSAGDSCRSNTADLGVLRRPADDRSHEHDGHRHRRPREPQLRQERRLHADAVDPARELSRSSRRTSSTSTGTHPRSGHRRTRSSSSTA